MFGLRRGYCERVVGLWAAGAAMILALLAGLVLLGGEVGAQEEAVGEIPAPEAAVERAYSDPDEVNGVFTLTLEGPVAEGYSFYVETDFGSGSALICTTDPEMNALGYAPCVEGGQSVPFVVASGHEISYRILGNPGNELSQFVIDEGSVVASEGVTVSAAYTFPEESGNSLPEHTGYAGNDGAPTTGEPAAGGDRTGTEEPGTTGESVAAAQYADEETTAAVPPAEDPGAEETTAAAYPGDIAGDATTGGAQDEGRLPVLSRLSDLLPQSGGVSVALLGGAAALILGGFAIRKFLV